MKKESVLYMRRGCSGLAAVFMILSLVMQLASSSNLQNPPVIQFRLLGTILTTVVLMIVLFRGRKDVAAGALLFATVIGPVLSVAHNLLSLLFVGMALGEVTMLYTLLSVFSGLGLAVFLGLSGVECLIGGRISTCGGRVLLWLLPILCFGIELCAQMLLCLKYGMSTGEMISSSLIYQIPRWIGPVLMGISICVPGKEKIVS